jgi:hypothetical protein
MTKADYLKVYRLTVHYKNNDKKGSITETIKNLSLLDVDLVLSKYKNLPNTKLIKHSVAFM